jgi:hypothetical protein
VKEDALQKRCLSRSRLLTWLLAGWLPDSVSLSYRTCVLCETSDNGTLQRSIVAPLRMTIYCMVLARPKVRELR